MIELVSKIFKINEKTWAPELEVTVRIPLETIHDEIAFDPNFFEKFGREFFELGKNDD